VGLVLGGECSGEMCAGNLEEDGCYEPAMRYWIIMSVCSHEIHASLEIRHPGKGGLISQRPRKQ